MIKGKVEFYSGATDTFDGRRSPDGPVAGDVQLIGDRFYILDTPGYMKAIFGNPVKTADLTFEFAVGVFDVFGGGGCSTTFTLHLTVTDGVAHWDDPIIR